MLGKGDGGEVVAAGADHIGNNLALVDIQAASIDQVGVHRTVEKAVVDDVVDVAIEVVVVPAGGDRLEVAKVLAPGVLHQNASR
ncbi:hypothetical protein D3C84_1064870 [compost metagenome]